MSKIGKNVDQQRRVNQGRSDRHWLHTEESDNGQTEEHMMLDLLESLSSLMVEYRILHSRKV